VYKRLPHLGSEEKERLRNPMQKTNQDLKSTEVKADRKRLTIWAIILIVIAFVASYLFEPEVLKIFFEFMQFIITNLVL
jgi:t-SNARE complex subunit (syntaxin)